MDPATADSFDSKVITDWYALIKTLTTETPGYTPASLGESFGYTGVLVHESVHHGIPGKLPSGKKITDFR
jgi:hypothetical protein